MVIIDTTPLLLKCDKVNYKWLVVCYLLKDSDWCWFCFVTRELCVMSKTVSSSFESGSLSSEGIFPGWGALGEICFLHSKLKNNLFYWKFQNTAPLPTPMVWLMSQTKNGAALRGKKKGTKQNGEVVLWQSKPLSIDRILFRIVL